MLSQPRVCQEVRQWWFHYLVELCWQYVNCWWDKSKIEKLKKDLNKSFDMKELGPAKQILRIEISGDQKTRHLWVSQESYTKKVLERLSMP